MSVGMILKKPVLLIALSRSTILSEFWETGILSSSLMSCYVCYVSVMKGYISAQGNSVYFALLYSANPLRMVCAFSKRATDF